MEKVGPKTERVERRSSGIVLWLDKSEMPT